MTTVEAPISHLRENPFELAQEQLRKVADVFKIDPNLVRVLERCKKAVVVSIPFSRRVTVDVTAAEQRELVDAVRARTFSYEAGRTAFRERLALICRPNR